MQNLLLQPFQRLEVFGPAFYPGAGEVGWAEVGRGTKKANRNSADITKTMLCNTLATTQKRKRFKRQELEIYSLRFE